MQKVLSCSETKKYVFDKKNAKYVHLHLLYVLDSSGSFEMHIEKL